MVTLEYRDLIQQLQFSYYKGGISSILIMKESVGTYISVFAFDRFNPFYEVFNEMMSDLSAAGILDLCSRNTLNPKGLNWKISKIGPQVLTMDHLFVGFQFCTVLLIVSMILFGLEIALKHHKNIMTKMEMFLRRKMLGRLKSKEPKSSSCKENNIETKKKKYRKFL